MVNTQPLASLCAPEFMQRRQMLVGHRPCRGFKPSRQTVTSASRCGCRHRKTCRGHASSAATLFRICATGLLRYHQPLPTGSWLRGVFRQLASDGYEQLVHIRSSLRTGFHEEDAIVARIDSASSGSTLRFELRSDLFPASAMTMFGFPWRCNSFTHCLAR